MPNKLLVRNPSLNAFIYSLLYELTNEQKKRLSKPFMFVAKSERRAKNFSEFSTLDEKVRFLSELGFENALVFFQDKIGSVNGLKVILEKYEQKKVASAAKDIIDLKVFVSSDKQVKHLLSLMADTISHKSYFLNLEYSRVGYHIKNWKSEINTPSSKELIETVDNSDLVIKTVLNSCNLLSQSDSISGVNQYQIKVLLYLYGFRHTFISKQKIWDFFAGDFTKGKCTSALKGLSNNDMVKKHTEKCTDLRQVKYGISASGIDATNEFINRVLKQNNY